MGCYGGFMAWGDGMNVVPGVTAPKADSVQMLSCFCLGWRTHESPQLIPGGFLGREMGWIYNEATRW